MGLPPESAGENGNDRNFNSVDEDLINYAQNTSEDSDNEDNPYEGYQPIPFGDQGEESSIEHYCNGEDSPERESINERLALPHIVSADVEVEKEVWSNPRPKELGIELDTSKTQQIMAAMSTIILPTSAIPEWARDISEDKWKENLLERIRQRKEYPNQASLTFEN